MAEKKQITREEFDEYFAILDDEPEVEEEVEDTPIKLVEDDEPVIVNYGGVDITVKPDMLGDMRVLFLMGKVNKRSVPVIDKLGYYNDLMELIVDGDLYDVYTAIAEENGGVMGADEMGEFIKTVLEAAGAKN